MADESSPRRVTLHDTLLHRTLGPSDLRTFPPALFAEHRHFDPRNYSRRVDGHSPPTPSRLLVDDDSDVSVKRRAEPHEALEGEVVEATAIHL